MDNIRVICEFNISIRKWRPWQSEGKHAAYTTRCNLSSYLLCKSDFEVFLVLMFCKGGSSEEGVKVAKGKRIL